MKEEWKIIVMILILNIGLSLLQFLLEKIKDKTETEIDNKLHAFLIKIEEVLRWAMGKK